ncbi:TrmH family RNA methyltransferase [Shimazuella kribbensis]|uniref:TrmH family RNA methyltransferase n=1 Tax=Shimazuella kribbensis TaxID=139808 RepID=UPI0004030887|nr:RNA methyltransferase [Shimazuella kribbensis]
MYYFITSPQNLQVKRWKKLLAKKGRKNQGTYLVEGVHLLQEAIKTETVMEAVIVEEGKQSADHLLSFLEDRVPIYQLPSTLFSQLTETEQSQGVIAEVQIPQWDLEQQVEKSKRIVVLDEIQDPGNLGTILRTASAAGVDLVVLGRGTVDLFNSKVIRSTMGAVFRLPIVEADLLEWIPKLKEAEIKVVGTSPHQGVYSFDYKFPDRVAIVLGNEGKGINDAVLQMMDQAVMIPMFGATESYNVSITTGMLLYECMRQQMKSEK